MRKRGKNLLYAGICILALTGCSMTSYGTTAAATVESQQDQPPKDFGVMGKITAVDGSTITVVLADNYDRKDGEKPTDGAAPSEKPADGTTPPEKLADGTTPPEKPADGTTPSEKPADGTTPPEKPADGTAQSMPEMNFNGETKTYTISSSATITKGMEQESASVSDLTTDSVVRITLDGDTVTGVNIMN